VAPAPPAPPEVLVVSPLPTPVVESLALVVLPLPLLMS
jgi:hypothetical protein